MARLNCFPDSTREGPATRLCKALNNAVSTGCRWSGASAAFRDRSTVSNCTKLIAKAWQCTACRACSSSIGVLLKSMPGLARCMSETQQSMVVNCCNNTASLTCHCGSLAGMGVASASVSIATAKAASPRQRSKTSRPVMCSAPTQRRSRQSTACRPSTVEALDAPGMSKCWLAKAAMLSPASSNFRKVLSNTEPCSRPKASGGMQFEAQAKHCSRPMRASRFIGSVSIDASPSTAHSAKVRMATPRKF
mmetsp:Transcript_169085/g.543411  ORF Transcript_169085/g.543411 Transcript_169085/m.543411 type:complete len:249 (+) Transcript_169085:1163-1909(+)